MSHKRFTKWTPELRARLFDFSKTPVWKLKVMITDETKTLRRIRRHPQKHRSLEDLNYRKNRLQAMKDQLEKLKRIHGEKAVRDALKSKNDPYVLRLDEEGY